MPQAPDRIVRLAGLLYLVVAIVGPFALIYVPGKIMVPGDPSATIANLKAHHDLFRAAITAGLVSQICFVASILLLYRILRDVGPTLAVIMVAVILLQAPLGLVSLSNEAATLALSQNTDFLAAFDQPQRDAITLLLLKADKAGTVISQTFWGLWLFPLGTLVWRSGFLPRWLGVWLIINGATYVILSAIGLWRPDLSRSAFLYATPAMLGELALALWMAVMGARPGTSTTPQIRMGE